MRLQRALWASVFLLFAASSAFAQQVFVDSVWVHNVGYDCSIDSSKPRQLICGPGAAGGRPSQAGARGPAAGDISNNPHIEFDQFIGGGTPNPGSWTSCHRGDYMVYGSSAPNFCNSVVALCTDVGWSNHQEGATDFALDFIKFEVFRYTEGSNPLDPGSTPPLRTFFLDNPGYILANTDSESNGDDLAARCAVWDGSINVAGEFGKQNGQFGFRATVSTNQTGESGNITISQVRAYPGSFTYDFNDNRVDERPITVDVTNVHVVRTTPTVVGKITGVAAQPYNIKYRISKDATMYVTIYNPLDEGLRLVSKVVDGRPRVGEGTPMGTLQNGDAWNGRHFDGSMMPPGVYLASLQAVSRDQYGKDISLAVTRQLSIDPLQITDIRLQPLTSLSTSLAVMSYMLTEPATVYIDIYPPGTHFTQNPYYLHDVNNQDDKDPSSAAGQMGVRKEFGPRRQGETSAGAEVLPVRHIEEHKVYRKSVISFWDGRDHDGDIVDDGDYPFVLYASLSSHWGQPFPYNPGGGCYAGTDCNTDRRIWSSVAKTGFLTVSRGMVTISQVGPSSAVIGSSPPVAGLDPFNFSYSLSRDALVSLKIYDVSGKQLIKTLVDNEVRPGNFLNRERWLLPTNDSGYWVSSGTYLVQLTAADPFFPKRVSTTTALFPINLFRITDIRTTSLLTGATDVLTLSYQLSQPMVAVWNIYPPGTLIESTSTWPPCGKIEPGACSQVQAPDGSEVEPLITIKGMRPGRLRITEFWDGRDREGLFVSDGNYVFTLTAESTTTPKFFASDKIMGTLTVARGSIIFPIFNITPTFPALFNSSETISLPPYEIDYSLTRQSSVTIQVLTMDNPPQVIRTLISGDVRDPNILNREFWDARDDGGNFVNPDFYIVRAVAEDLASVLSSGSTAQQTISVDPLRIFDVAYSPLRPDFGSALIAYQVSETMKVAIKIYNPGTYFDNNGNPMPPENQSLVQRIVGVRPARTEVTEEWDGKDETGSIVPDGNYLFKIAASTDINAIDSITGDVLTGGTLAEDLVIAELPVVRGGSVNPFSDFVNNSFIYPNPVQSGPANFKIYVPVECEMSMKIYNIAGELVRDENFGTYPQDSYIEFSWDKTNSAGRPVAHGVYFALIRGLGTRDATHLQMVKKLLIP